MSVLDLSIFFKKVGEHSGQGDGIERAKQAASLAALDLVKPGTRVGLGTGSTVDFFLQGLAGKIRQGFQIEGGVPTSKATERRARELGIPLISEPDYHSIETDIYVDGADRVDKEGCLIKGGGGALLREKLVASHSREVCILVDRTKLIDVFDDSFAVPVECVEFGIENTVAGLAELGCGVALRQAGDELYRTDNGHLIVDCSFAEIPEPLATGLRLSTLTGIVEVGIFSSLLDHLIVGLEDGDYLAWSRSHSLV